MLLELNSRIREGLLQRIAKFTVGFLISTLFIAGAGVGIGVVGAPVANADTMKGTPSLSVGVNVPTIGKTTFTYNSGSATDGGGGGGIEFYWESSTVSTFTTFTSSGVIASASLVPLVVNSGSNFYRIKVCVVRGSSCLTSGAYSAAGQVQTISFTSTAPTSPIASNTYTPTATSTSGLAVSITIDDVSTANTACSINLAGLVTFGPSAGVDCIINANQSGNGTYAGASQVQQIIRVSTASAPTIASASISGVAQVGSQLTATAGAITGSPTPTVSYQWTISTLVGGTYSSIAGATSSNYVPVASDLGKFIKVVITATNSTSPGTASATSTATAAVSAAIIAAPAISGVTVPTTDATPTPTISATDSYTASISWDSAGLSGGVFKAGSIETATITLTAKSGYTLSGVTANFFTVSGATSTNSANSGVITAVFPATGVLYSVASATSSQGGSKTVTYGQDASASETTITLTRAGDSLPNPPVSISVSGGTWSATQGTGTTIPGTSATIIYGSPATITLTASTGTLTLSRLDTLTVSTETATVLAVSPRTYAVTIEADTPDAPSVTETTTANVSFTVKWNRPVKIGSGSISFYTLAVSPDPVSGSSTFTVLPSGGATESYTVNNLENGRNYEFSITARNNGGKVSGAALANGKPSWIPNAPIKPLVTAYTDTATITWSAPNDNGESITAYMVESSTVGSSTWYTVISSTTLTSVEVSGLTGKSNLVYRVSATNSNGRGPNSVSSDAVTPGKSSHILTLSPSATRANFQSGVSSTITTITSAGGDFNTGDASFSSTLRYEVSDTDVCEISAGSVRPKTSGGKSGSCLVTVKSIGNSKYNEASDFFTFTVDPIEPDDPDTSTVTTTSSSIVVNWNALTSTKDGGNGGSGIKGYQLEYALETSTSWTTLTDTSTVLNRTIAGLSANTSYKFILKAINNSDKYSGGRGFTSKTNAATKSARSLALSGGRTINYGEALPLTKSGVETGTVVWSTNDPLICTVDSSGNVTSVGEGTCVVSFSVSGDSDYEDETAVSTFSIQAIDPDAPSLSDPSAGEESLTLSWTAPTNKGGAARISGYTVTSIPSGFGCTTTGATSCTITGLDPSQTYSFTITATSSSGKTSVISGSKSAKPNAKASTTKSDPAPTLERGPIGPSTSTAPTTPAAPAAPRSNQVLPPVRIPATTTSNLPPATAVPTSGNIVTLKNGKEEVAVLTVVQEPVSKPSASAAAPAATTKAEIKGADWGMAVVTTAAPVAAAPSTGGSTSGGGASPSTTQITFEKGASAQTTGNGFAPRTTISVYLFSDPILIGTIRTDGNGNFKGSIRIPADMPEGNHTLQLNGTTKTFEVRTASLPVVVRAKQAAAAKPTPTPTATPIAKKSSLTFSVTFGMNSWWVDSNGYKAMRAAIKKVPASAKIITVTITGNKQKTNVDPYPNIGLDRAKAVAKAMRSLGFTGRYSVAQSDEQGLESAEYRRADVTISWTTS